MTRTQLAKLLGGLALACPIALPLMAEDKTNGVSIYTTRQHLRQAGVQETPEQAVPKSTESKPAEEAPAEEAKEEEEEVGLLMQYLRCTSVGPCLECNGIKVSGWLSQGFTWNPDSPDNRFNFPLTFNDRSNEYQMNQFYLAFEKAVNTEGCEWDCGFRVDFLYGTDYYFTTAVGLETNPDGTQNWNSEDGPRFQLGSATLYGLAMPQAYFEVFTPIGSGLTTKFGHFYTPFGYETVTATGNFFYSHAFTHQNFEPFTHTGFLSAYNLSESVKVQAGVLLGWDTFDRQEDKACFAGAIGWTSDDKNTTLFYGFMAGEEPGLLGNEETRIYHSIYMTQKLCENLTSVTGTDLVFQNNGSTRVQGGTITDDDAEAYSIYQYFIYDINKCWSWGLRFEAARDDDNLRIIPVGGAVFVPGTGLVSVPGSNFFSLTTGLNYKPCDNVRIRPELRWDWSNFPSGQHGVGAFDDFSDKNQFTASFDVIFTF